MKLKLLLVAFASMGAGQAKLQIWKNSMFFSLKECPTMFVETLEE